MNKYSFSARIDTPIVLRNGDFTVDGYSVSAFDDENWQSGSILMTKTIEAENIDKAIYDFFIPMGHVLNALSVLSQTIVHPPILGSFLAIRENDNPDHIFLARISNKTDTRGIAIGADMAGDIQHLADLSKSSSGVTYLREAIGALSPLQIVSMLSSAAEAFAEKKEVPAKCRKGHELGCECGTPTVRTVTDREALKKILGKDSLYNDVFGPDGIRHKVDHGQRVNDAVVGITAQELYSRLMVEYLQEQGITSAQDYPHAPRNIMFDQDQSWCQMKDRSIPTLLELQKKTLSDESIVPISPPMTGY